jgi:hypothetical protein
MTPTGLQMQCHFLEAFLAAFPIKHLDLPIPRLLPAVSLPAFHKPNASQTHIYKASLL